MRNGITIEVELHKGSSAYIDGSFNQLLCISELRKYVDLPPNTPTHALLTLTNKKPKGSNFHIFRWSKAQREWTMRGVEGGSPALYYTLLGIMDRKFKRSHTVYAWLTA